MSPRLPALVVPWLLALPTLALEGTPLDDATLAFRSGEYARVVAIAAASDPEGTDGARLQYLAGEAQLVLDAPEAAEAAFREVLARRPAAVPARIGLGRALTRLQRFDEADATLSAALAAAPDDAAALAAMGLLRADLGQLDEARKTLERAWRLDPGPLVTRAHVEVLLRMDDNPAAAQVIESFVKANPAHPLGPFLLAWTMERENDAEAAIEQYQAALTLDARFIDAHKNLAILCHTLSDSYRNKPRVALAFEHYERYFALGGRDPKLAAMYETLAGFREQLTAQPDAR